MIKNLLQHVSTIPNCIVKSPSLLPMLEEGHSMPTDLLEFYELCGGIIFYSNSLYTIEIVPPNEFLLTNPVILGQRYDDDISTDWYIVAKSGSEQLITIDMNKERLGRCYDSFYDRHGIVGSCPVIATSFTDLLERVIENQGKYWYWLSKDFVSLGDAYD